MDETRFESWGQTTSSKWREPDFVRSLKTCLGREGAALAADFFNSQILWPCPLWGPIIGIQPGQRPRQAAPALQPVRPTACGSSAKCRVREDLLGGGGLGGLQDGR